MIDVTREINKFKPIDLNFIPGRYAPTSDAMYESFVLYNKALHQIQLNKEDAAKNYLRKATSLFPDFYEANMVLGILIFASGDRIGAVRIFNSISDNSKREDAIKLLDHLVQEAEKPETAKTSGKGSFADRHMVGTNIIKNTPGRATEREVLGGNFTAQENAQRRTDEGNYSRGRIFEKSGNFYEPQESRISSQNMQKRYGQTRGGAPMNANAERKTRESFFVDETTTGSRGAGARVERRNVPANDMRRVPNDSNDNKSEGKLFREQLKDSQDLKFLNKCLVIIIAVLLLFTIILSTLLVNRTSTINELNDKLSSVTSVSQDGNVGK